MIDHDEPWDRRLQTLLALVVAINVLPHVLEVPIWATATAVVSVVWKLLYLNKGYPLPKRWLLAILSVGACYATWTIYHSIFGVEPASALLVVLASLKLLETNRYRDAMLVIFTSYFLLMAHLLTSQSLLSTIFMAFDILFITTLMFHLHKRDRRKSVRSFRPAMRMLVLTLPIWLLFFFVFPRFTAAFWDPKTQTTSTGFSDELNPGAVESLAESEEPVLRASFKGDWLPSPELLYWRGGVLSLSDGMRWSRLQGAVSSRARETDYPEKKKIDYEVWLEPGFQRWLFVLDYVVRVKSGDWLSVHGVRNTGAFVYEAAQEFQSRVAFDATSSFDAPEQRLTREEREQNLQLPKGLDTPVLELAKSFATDTDAEKIADRALEYFSANRFHYTLRPGPMNATTGPAQLTEFLFRKKIGFCEHFAATFATLMRLAGVPSRVVIGFQGGRYNDFGGYLLVRHLDAHAWTEISVESPTTPSMGHWKRVDPTQSVAPLRLQLGGDYLRLDSQDIASGLSSEELRNRLGNPFMRFVRKTSLAWDAVQMKWNAFLLDYNFNYQLELLSLLGFKNASAVLLIAVLLLGLLIFAGAVVWSLRRKSKKVDPIALEWNRFCAKLERAGLARKRTEGPLDFASRISQHVPEKKSEIEAIVKEYIEIRYGNTEPREVSQGLSKLRKSIRRLRVPTQASSSSSRDAES